MAIVIVCQSCHKRFKVSEKFAGKKGPCPNCKETIYVPKKDEQVEIHTAEHSEASARGRGGDLVLKPIERQETKLPMWAVISIGVACLLALIIALVFRGAEDSTKRVVAAFGAVVLAPTLVLAAYTFLRDDDLEPYRGMWLWIRTAICSAVYILCWVAYGYVVPEEWTDELWKWAFLGPAFGAAGATAAFACFDLDFGSGFFHFTFYAGVTLLLALIMGLPVFGG